MGTSGSSIGYADYRTGNHQHGERTPTLSEEVVASLARDAGTLTVALHGEVDVLTVDQVRVALTEAVGQRPDAIVSTGLGALIFGFQRARDAGIAFSLAHPSRGVRQILVLSGLLEVVDVTE
jgi:anti-sigma B factor antagonist